MRRSWLLPLVVTGIACSKEAPNAIHPADGPPASAAPTSSVVPASSVSSAPSAASSLGGIGSGDGPFAGGACSTDADCQAFYDCCMFVAQCGTKANAKKQNDLCSCCVSCPAPQKPPPLPKCGCVAGKCAAKP